jgi:hypothetical protein
VTSIYLLAHAASTAKGQPATIVDFQGTKAKRITLDRGRTDKTLSSFGLPDKFDIYVSDAGLLLGIARSFDPKNSVNHKESAYAFSDYRSVGGQTGVLLPFQITEYRNNRAFEIITVTEYRFDVLPDSTIFETRRVSPPIPAVQPRKQ